MSPGLAHSLADPVRVLGKEEGAGSAQLCSSPQALSALKSQTEAIPCVVGDEEVWTSDVQYQLSVSPAWGRSPLPDSRVCVSSNSWLTSYVLLVF